MYVSGRLSTSYYMRRVTHIFVAMRYTCMFKQKWKGKVAQSPSYALLKVSVANKIRK